MLAMNLNQLFTQRFQIGNGRWVAIDPRLGAPVGSNHATQEALIGRQLAGVEPLGCCGQVLDIETGGEVGSLAAVAHATRIGALAQAEPQSTQQNGFTRPGFPRNGGHATGEVEFETINDRIVLDR